MKQVFYNHIKGLYIMGKVIMNGRMLVAKQKDEVHYGKIECVAYDEYYFYDGEGDGVAIAILNTIEVSELFFTGVVRLSKDVTIINPEHAKS